MASSDTSKAIQAKHVEVVNQYERDTKKFIKNRDTIKMVLTLIATCFAFVSYGVRKLQRDPELVVKFASIMNTFDDSTDFNLKKNVYLNGVFAPVGEENFNVPTEVISGSMPKDLRGLFLRIGPNPIPHHVSKGYHWFDGHGMIHSLHIEDQSALYSNQWIRTKSYELSQRFNETVLIQLGEMRGLTGILKAVFVIPMLRRVFRLKHYEMGTANTAMALYNNKLYACHEGSLPFEIQWQRNNSFRSIGYDSFNRSLNYAFTAHSKKDPEDGRLYFNGYEVEDGRPAMKYGKIHEDQVESYFDVKLPIRSFAHDMMITENYALLVESSIAFDVNGIMQGEFFNFKPQHKFRIGVVPKNAMDEKEIRWFQFDKAYAMIHSLNAWEEGNEIIIYAPIGEEFNGLDPRNSSVVNTWVMSELRLNMETGATSMTVIANDKYVEFPNVHPKYLGRKSRYGFAGQFIPGVVGFDRIQKLDMFEKKFDSSIGLPEGLTCGEPVLIPKDLPKGDESDDVYLAIIAHNSESNESEWILYDGKTMSEIPVVRLRLGGKRVPMGFHGAWIREEDLQKHMEGL